MAENIDDIVFNIVNQDAVDRLIRDGEIELPKKKIAVSKDEQWNNKQMTSKVLRGIQNGDSVQKIAKSMLDTVGNNEFSAIRNARTMTTSAENHGRLDSFKNLSNQGVVMKKEWEATPDDRTRPSHVDIDGEEQDIDKVFSNGCMFPGDGKGPAEEVWMCRCAMGSHIIGFKRSDGSVSKIEYGRDRTTHDEQMQDEKNRRKQDTKNVSHVVNGKDISSTWERRPDKFDFEIEDVINAQGFDGLPRVVSAEEFDRYVEESNFIAQRTYSAPDQETLDAYQQQLYKGKWYVDCSTGGANYGQGMYCAGNVNGVLTDSVKNEMKYYIENSFGNSNIIETLTTTSDFRWIDYKNVRHEFFLTSVENKYANDPKIIDAVNEGRKQIEKGVRGNPFYKNIKDLIGESDYDKLRNYYDNTDEGVMATLMGYDGILTHNVTPNISNIVNANDSQHIVILNRTKVIFKGE